MYYNIKIRKLGSIRQFKTYKAPIRKKYTSNRARGKNEPYTDFQKAKKRARRSFLSSLSRTKQKIYDLARTNQEGFSYFVTLTFNPDRVDSFNYALVVKSMKSWLDSLRKKIPDIKYLGVPERHKSGRYHFHFLISDIFSILIDSGYKTRNGQVIYNLSSYRLGFSTAIKLYDTENISKYITKYITKDLMKHTKHKKRYWHSRNLQFPFEECSFVLDVNSVNETLREEADYHKSISNDKQELNIFEIKELSI